MEGQTNVKELVRLAKHRDAHAFSLLYEMVYEDLYRMALYTLGNVHDAEDVVSDTVLDAYAGIGSLRDEMAFRRWIFKILSNKCKRKLKEYIGRREHEQQLYDEKDEGISLEERLPNEQDDMKQVLDRDEIGRAFRVLSKEERLIVTMVVYGGYDSREVSKILHKNRNTVRSKYKRALDKLKNQIRDKEVTA
ncbi:MAG: RNA polymerase sigma factor [Lachnospira sp.]|nr:RNA polymerase sigma factor [Lachnospira sp.]